MRRPSIFTAFALAAFVTACGPAEPAEQPAPPAAPEPVAVAPAAPPPPTATASAAPTIDPSRPVATPVPVPPAIAAIVAADRSDADKKLDAGRHPGELLAFIGVAPGWKVAELATGGGYTGELLARAVGPKGKVYAENNKFIVEKFAAEPWKARLALPADKNVVRVERELDDPLPPDAKNLDAVVVNLFYHDVYWMGGPEVVAKMNAAIFKSLKPGGVYVIVDHAGRDGTGANEVKTLHRIEEKVVRADLEKAGFKFVASSDFLRNPADPRDWNASPGAAADKRGTSDRFALKFAK